MTTNTNGTDVTITDVHDLAKILRGHRHWHCREQYTYPLHPVVVEAIGLARPVDWHQLVLEWPHRSTEKHDEIAYTRDEGKGMADVQTRTGAGKYLARHWPKLPSNILRDLVAAHVAKMEGSCKFLAATTEEIVRSVQEGPTSCMQWGDDELEDTGGRHPYAVYAPELGWRAAVRTNPAGQIIGRALVHDGTHMRNGNDRNASVFVRSYKCYDDVWRTTEYSHADEKLEAWLEKQGVAKKSSWPRGTPFKYMKGPLLPYLDGGDTQVSEEYNGVHYRIEDGSEDGYNCCNTDGTADYVGEVPSCSCDRCEDGCDEDDLTYIEAEETSICDSCLSRYYTRTTEHGLVRDESVVQTRCGEVTWDGREDTPDNVHYLDEGMYAGDYAMEDDTVYALDEQVWHVDDIGTDEGCIVQLCDDSHHDGEYAPVEDCVQVEGEWFHRAADVEHDIIVEVECGSKKGGFVRQEDTVAVDVGAPESRCIWWNGDEITAMPMASERVERGMYIVDLCADAENVGGYADIVDAIFVREVGWFMPEDLEAGTIVRIMDDVYALASDLVAV